MKKIILMIAILAGFTISCTKNFEDFNTDKKRASEVPGDFLFSNAQKNLGDQLASTNVNLNIFKLWAQYWTETTYTDEANYDLTTRNISDAQFRILYRDILKDLREAHTLVSAEEAPLEEDVIVKQNKLHVITLVEATAWNYLLLLFGDIPYSEALADSITQPKYDDAHTIYMDLLSRVREATDGLDESYGSFDNDLYFGGDVAMWKKFGNSLIIKMAITLADVDSETARTFIEGAYGGAFEESEDARMVYPGGSNSNPLWQDLVASGRNDFVAANTIVDILVDLEDPRLDDYFTTVPDEDFYQGGLYGRNSPFDQLSHIAEALHEPTYPIIILDFTETAFYLAEAAERGYSVGQSAEEWYNQAVTSSILFWNGTQEEADAYLAEPDVNYQTAPGEWREKIGVQEWIAFYSRGLEGWTTWRRLDAPTFNIPPSISSEDQIPVRFTYPISEQTLNSANYNSASDAIGDDLLTTPLFWDIQ